MELAGCGIENPILEISYRGLKIPYKESSSGIPFTLLKIIQTKSMNEELSHYDQALITKILVVTVINASAAATPLEQRPEKHFRL